MSDVPGSLTSVSTHVVSVGAEPPPREASYGQILKSSSIIGGTYAVNYLVGIVRVKCVAVLLGPSGVGLVGLYTAATGMLATIGSLGVNSSGVREVAQAHGSGNDSLVAATATALRRVCWITGVFGWALSAILAYPISKWVFDSSAHAWAIAVLGASLFLGSISNGQTAVLQGTRRISDLARLNVISVLFGTLAAVAMYAWLGEDGIVPVLIGTAAINVAFSWWFSRRIGTLENSQAWSDTIAYGKRFISLGAVFMWSAVLAALVGLALRALIVRELGLEANGLYQAAWGLSGMFAGFILSAMGTDFYPRVAGVAEDNIRVNNLVNEQTEIGILLALPGLIGTLTFAPIIMRLFYSSQFVAGAELLPLFVIGVFGQVVSWPMGIVLVAKGAKLWYTVAETSASVLKLAISAALLTSIGLIGTALAYPLMYLVYTGLLLFICKRVTGFQWSSASFRLLALSGGLTLLAFATQALLPPYAGTSVGAVLTVAGIVTCVRGVFQRLGLQHRVVRAACRVPGVRALSGI